MPLLLLVHLQLQFLLLLLLLLLLLVLVRVRVRVLVLVLLLLLLRVRVLVLVLVLLLLRLSPSSSKHRQNRGIISSRRSGRRFPRRKTSTTAHRSCTNDVGILEVRQSARLLLGIGSWGTLCNRVTWFREHESRGWLERELRERRVTT